MRIAIYEDNLIWSSRLIQAVRSLGHEPVLMRSPEFDEGCFEVAIVNLGSQKLPPNALVPELKSRGIKVIAHAGHKESPLLEMGNELGCDAVVSNSTLTFKLDTVLAGLD